MPIMDYIKLEKITTHTSSRDDGFQAALELIALFYSPEINNYKREKLPDGRMRFSTQRDPDGIGIDIPKDSHVTTSFLDEIFYRLYEKELLHHFRFRINDDRIYKKFQSISNRRKVSININWNEKNEVIEPTEEPLKKKRDVALKDR